MFRKTIILSAAVIVISMFMSAGCAVFRKNTMTDLDIPTSAGTSYAAFQNSPDTEPVIVSFNGKGPWDFTSGRNDAVVKSVLVKRTDAASYKEFPEASYAEKVAASEFTSGFTTYNFASVTASALNSYGQSITPGPDGPIQKVYDVPERLLKFPLRVGDEWSDTITVAEKEPMTIELSRKVVARGQVKVPAGSFFNCFMVRLIKTTRAGDDGMPTQTIMYFWWSPGVGLVAAVGSQPDEKQMYFKQADYVFRLKSYEVKD